MIEKTILDYLSAAGVVTYMQRPETKPSGEYVILEKTGSNRSNLITSSTFAVQSYAPTLYEAAELNEQVKSLLFSITDLDDVSAVRLNSDYNFTNTQDKQPRYQAVFEFTHY